MLYKKFLKIFFKFIGKIRPWSYGSDKAYVIYLGLELIKKKILGKNSTVLNSLDKTYVRKVRPSIMMV